MKNQNGYKANLLEKRVLLSAAAISLLTLIAATPKAISGETVFADSFTGYGVQAASGGNIVPGAPKPTGSAFAGDGKVFSLSTATGSAALAGGAFSNDPSNNFAQAVFGTTNSTTNATTQWVLSAAAETLSANKIVTISFDFYISSAAGGTKTLSLITYSQILNRGNFNEGRGLGINITTAGTINYYSGTGTSPTGTVAGSFSTDTLQNFKVTLDYSTHTFSATVAGLSFTGSFNPAVSDLRSVWLNNSTSNNVGFYYDNLKITVASAPQTLISSGVTDYVIALADDATPAEETAATKLQQYLHQISGATIPIQSETSVSLSAKQILVGAGTRVKALVPEQEWDNLEKDGFIVRTVGNRLILAGGRPRGTLYAVYDFLERQLGCRWWTPSEKDIPASSAIVVNDLDATHTPIFAYRGQHTTSLIDDPHTSPIENQEFATILRANGTLQPQTESWGSHNKIIGWAHTHFELAPPATHFAAHPEWYTNPNNGNKPYTTSAGITTLPSKGSSQLCLSAPGLIAEVTNRALANIANDPTAGFISITENDNGNYCQCVDCKAKRTTGGSQSAPNLEFVNAIAAAVRNPANPYPNFIVDTFAYRGTVDFPIGIVPDENVLIRFAPLTADWGHPLDSIWNGPTPPLTPSQNAQENVAENLPAWASATNQIFVWYYASNYKYTMLPYPNFQNLESDFRFFYENRVTGVFVQSDAYTNNVGDFVQMRAWVAAKMLWDPFLSQADLTAEFLDGYYGAAGSYLEEYLTLVQESYLDTERKLWADESAFSYMTYDVMSQGKLLFDQAEAAVSGNTTLLNRVKRERISFDLMWVYRYNPLKQNAAFQQVSFVGPSNPATFLQTVTTRASGFGVGDFQENNYPGRGSFMLNEVPRLEDKVAAVATLPTQIQSLITPGSEATDVIVLYPHDLTDVSLDIGNVVADPAASTGKALKITNSKLDWKVQYDMMQYGHTFFNGDHWRMFVEARVTATTWSGGLVYIGMYDVPTYLNTGSGNVFVRSLNVTDFSGTGYQIIPVGKSNTSPFTQSNLIPETGHIWLDFLDNPNVTALYIDRIFLVRMP